MACARFSTGARGVSLEGVRCSKSWKGLLIDVAREHEVAGVRLGDERLTDRPAVIVDRSASQSNLSIPSVMQGHS